MTARRRGTARVTLAALGAVAALGVSASGCSLGVPVSAAPQPVSSVPAGLLLPPPNKVVLHQRKRPKHYFDIYLVFEGELFPVVRPGADPTSQAVLRALEEGPTPRDGSGFESAIPSGAQPTVVAPAAKKIVTVGISVGDLSPLAIGQIVCTLTQSPALSKVRFEQEGVSVEVPTLTGSYKFTVGRSDFRNCLP